MSGQCTVRMCGLVALGLLVACTRDNPAFDARETETLTVGGSLETGSSEEGEVGSSGVEGDGDGDAESSGDGDGDGDDGGDGDGDGDGDDSGDGDPSGDGDGDPEPVEGCPDDDALVACYRFEGPNGLADGSGFGNHASAQSLGFAPGVLGMGLDCSESVEVMVPDSPSLDLSDEMTLSLWVFRELDVGQFKRALIDNPAQYGIWFVPEDGIHFSAVVGGMTHGVTLGPENVPVGVWTHLALVYDGGDLIGFVDGQVTFESGAAGEVATANTDPMGLGNGSPNYENTGCPGRLDEVQIYSRALTLGEIAELASL